MVFVGQKGREASTLPLTVTVEGELLAAFIRPSAHRRSVRISD